MNKRISWSTCFFFSSTRRIRKRNESASQEPLHARRLPWRFEPLRVSLAPIRPCTHGGGYEYVSMCVKYTYVYASVVREGCARARPVVCACRGRRGGDGNGGGSHWPDVVRTGSAIAYTHSPETWYIIPPRTLVPTRRAEIHRWHAPKLARASCRNSRPTEIAADNHR